MSERFTPHESEPPRETTTPGQDARRLSPEGQSRLQGTPETTQPGDLNHPMEGGGQGFFYGDGRGGLVTPEMSERYHSPENQIEKEPYTYRAVPTDPQQAADDASQATPADPQAAADDNTTPSDDQPVSDPLPPSDNKLKETAPHQALLSDRGQSAMQGVAPDTEP